MSEEMNSSQMIRAMREYVPPGYKDLKALRDELGPIELRNRLFKGELQAFFLADNGDITRCAKKLWASEHAEFAIRSGRLGERRMLVGDGSTEYTTNEIAREGIYVSPFLALMLQASQEFDLGSAKGKLVKKETLTAWFRQKRLPDGSPISQKLAEYMATLCRPPTAMRGGNKRGVVFLDPQLGS